MKPAKFLLLAVSVFTLGAGAWLGLAWWQKDQPRWEHHWLRDVAVVKAALAREAGADPRPRLWLVGGSSTWFGFDSRLLAAATGRRVVNLGTHAEVPAAAHGWLLRQVVRPGDIVVAAPELEALVRPYEYTGYAAEEVPLLAPGFLESAGWGERWRWYRAVPRPRIVGGVLAALAPAERRIRPRSEGALRADLEARLAGTFAGTVPAYYNFLELTADGDFARPRGPVPHGGSDYALGPGALPWSAARLDEWSAIARWAQAQGARPIFAWQPFEARPASPVAAPAAAARLRELAARLEAGGWELAGPPGDAVFDSAQFYDTAYHLTTEAAQERSRRLAAWLQAHGGAVR